MKHLSVPTVLAVMLAMSNPAAAAPNSVEFQLDENYAEMEPAAGEGTDEIDPNAMQGLSDDEDASVVIPSPKPIAEPTKSEIAPEKPATATKSVTVKKSDSATDAPAPKEVKPKAPPAREIPLIETDNPAESSPDVNYVTGGIGDDERSSIEAAKADYNVHVTSASVSGAFVGDARVIITRKNGNAIEEMLNVVAGPLLYVKLPAGTYSLDATLGDQKKHQNFTVGKKGSATIHLGWKVSSTSAN